MAKLSTRVQQLDVRMETKVVFGLDPSFLFFFFPIRDVKANTAAVLSVFISMGSKLPLPLLVFSVGT